MKIVSYEDNNSSKTKLGLMHTNNLKDIYAPNISKLREGKKTDGIDRAPVFNLPITRPIPKHFMLHPHHMIVQLRMVEYVLKTEIEVVSKVQLLKIYSKIITNPASLKVK